MSAAAAPTSADLDAPRPGRRLARGLAGLIPLTVFALAAAILVPGLAGYQRYVITSGSMTGTVDRGSLVYAKAVPVTQLRVGDIITYEPPPDAGPKGMVTHRIVWTGRERGGVRTFRTKGDANPVPDPWTFVLERPTEARYAAHIPYLGYVFAALSLKLVRMLAIALPAVLVALVVIARVWREAGEEVRRRAAGPAEALPESGA